MILYNTSCEYQGLYGLRQRKLPTVRGAHIQEGALEDFTSKWTEEGVWKLASELF